MTWEGFFFYLITIPFLFCIVVVAVNVFAGRFDEPRLNMECMSPLGETLCDNCVDLDACQDECCPYDWVDFPDDYKVGGTD
jgi:hypothetical protein